MQFCTWSLLSTSLQCLRWTVFWWRRVEWGCTEKFAFQLGDGGFTSLQWRGHRRIVAAVCLLLRSLHCDCGREQLGPRNGWVALRLKKVSHLILQLLNGCVLRGTIALALH